MDELRISNDPDWFAACSDDEIYESSGLAKGQLGPDNWRPLVQDIAQDFELIAKKPDGVIPLHWTCGGHRPPTPNADEEYETDEDEKMAQAMQESTEDANKNAKLAEKNDFEFKDESVGAVTTPRRPLGSQRELKGSARKKTTDFKSVLNNMKRHRQMDAAKDAAQKKVGMASNMPKQ